MRWGLVLLAFGLSACASYFERKACEQINWYEHGKQVALRGERYASDETYAKCRKVDAEFSESDLDRGFKEGMSTYCQPQTVLTYGKNGEFVNFDFCDPGQLGLLKTRHAEGVLIHCEADNGFRVGASGKKYNKICPSHLEKAFLKEFAKGRKKYLKAMVEETEGKIRDNEQEIMSLNSRQSFLAMELASLPPPRRVTEKTFDGYGNYHESSTDEDHFSSRRTSLKSEIDNISVQVRKKEADKQILKNNLYDYRRELDTYQD